MWVILSKILDAVYTFLELICLYRYVDIFCEQKSRRGFGRYRRLAVPGMLIMCNLLTVTFLNSLVLTSPYTVMVMLAECIIFVPVFWRCDLLNTIAIVGGYFFVLSTFGSVEILLTGFRGGEELIRATVKEHGCARILYLLVFGTNWFLINMLFGNWLKKKKINISSMKYTAYISVAGLVGLTFIVTQMLAGFHVGITAILFGYVLLVSSGVFAVYYIVKSKNLQMRVSLLDIQNEMLEQNYQQLNDFYVANAGLAHDMKHHLRTLHHMLQEGEEAQARQYIESLQKTLDYSEIKVWTGIDVIDVILNEMRKEAESRGICLNIHTSVFVQDIKIEKKDMCSLFANLLENAVEAAKEEITVTIRYEHNALIIEEHNDYQIEPIIRGERLITTKKNTLRHGLGTYNIERIVCKYDGVIKYEKQNHKFHASIMILDIEP